MTFSFDPYVTVDPVVGVKKFMADVIFANKLDPAQERYIEKLVSSNKFMGVSTRQSGITAINVGYMLWLVAYHMHNGSKCDIGVFSYSSLQSHHIRHTIEYFILTKLKNATCRGNIFGASHVNTSGITFLNGSTIIFRSSPLGARGVRLDVIIIDNFSYFSPTVLGEITTIALSCCRKNWQLVLTTTEESGAYSLKDHSLFYVKMITTRSLYNITDFVVGGVIQFLPGVIKLPNGHSVKKQFIHWTQINRMRREQKL